MATPPANKPPKRRTGPEPCKALFALLAEPLQAALPARWASLPISGVATDSRLVKAGTLFAASKGRAHDGHDHVDAAMARGAAFVLAERPLLHVPHLVVDSPAQHLSLAASRLFAEAVAGMTLVGVTGTNGKTTCVHLIASVLAEAHQQAAAIGTLGVSRFVRGQPMQIEESAGGLTTPQPAEMWTQLAQLARDGVRHVAIEATSIGLVQKRLAHIKFDVVAVSNLSQDHLEVHGTMAAYGAAKRLLLAAHWRGVRPAVLNVDDAFARSLAAHFAPHLLFSAKDPTADVGLVAATLAKGASTLSMSTPAGPLTVRSPLVGAFNVENILLTAAVSAALEVAPGDVARGLAGLAAVPGRLERVPPAQGIGPTVLVDFAHTPAALERSVATARKLTGTGRLFCVFGCGGDRDRDKRAQMGRAAARGADWSVVTSDNPRSEPPEAIIADIAAGFVALAATTRELPPAEPMQLGGVGTYAVLGDRRAAIAHAIAQAGEHDTVLLAGKGHEPYQIVGTRKLAFDDRVEARLALARWAPSARAKEEP